MKRPRSSVFGRRTDTFSPNLTAQESQSWRVALQYRLPGHVQDEQQKQPGHLPHAVRRPAANGVPQPVIAERKDGGRGVHAAAPAGL